MAPFSCSEGTAQATHREGQGNVVTASHELLPVTLDLLLLSQLLVVLHQLVNLRAGKGTGSTVTSAAACACSCYSCHSGPSSSCAGQDVPKEAFVFDEPTLWVTN